MAIPDFQTLMLPVLKASADGEIKISDVVSSIGTSLKLSEADLSELLPSGKQTTLANRVHWAKSYLGKAGLVTLTRRGYFQISEKGKEVLQSSPPAINTKFPSQLRGKRAGHLTNRNTLPGCFHAAWAWIRLTCWPGTLWMPKLI